MPQNVDSELLDLAAKLVKRALSSGAEIAEASARQGSDLSVRVRLGKPELVEEAGHRSVSLRVSREQRVALTSTSDLTPAGLERCVADALQLLDLSEPDACSGPAPVEALCSAPHPDLELFDPQVPALDAREALRRAEAAERAALAFDPRLTLSEGASFSRSFGTSALVLSSGFEATLTGSHVSLSVTPVVEDADGKKRRGNYWTAARHLSDLEDLEFVGQEAARRTLKKLGARKLKTCEVPVVFDPDAGRSLLGSFASCILGGALWRKTSYLLDREGTAVANEQVTLVDDPLLPRAPASRPFDGEGLRSRRQVVVENGVLRGFLLDWYSARKLNRSSTASAGRSGGSISPTTSNFFMQAGQLSPEDILRGTSEGLYVTDMMGFGFNAITGDFSRGAAGFWIQNGELAHPVSEVTISSNMDAMLRNIDAVGNDLRLRTALATPTLRISQMVISGT